MKNLYFLDFETTGLNPYHDEVIEIGIRKFKDEDCYTTLVVPDKENGIHYKYVSKKITEVTGITDSLIVKNGVDPIGRGGGFKHHCIRYAWVRIPLNAIL